MHMGYRRTSSCPSHRDHQQQQQQQLYPQQQHPSVQGSIPDNTAVRSSYIYQRMDFDEGMHSFVNLQSLNPASFWNSPDEGSTLHEINPLVEATLVFNVGQVHRRKGDLDAASQCYDRTLDVLHHHGTNSTLNGRHLHQHPSIIIPILHNIGQLQYRRGEISKATEMYSSALSHARGMYGERHPHVASALNCLRVLHYHDANSSDEDGVEVYSSAVGGVKKTEGGGEAGSSSNSVDSSSNTITTSSSSSDDSTSTDRSEKQKQQHTSTGKAMSLFQQALTIRHALLGPTHVDVATVLNNIGRIHVQLDQFDQALNYYEDALRIRRATLGVDSLDYAATAFNAGQSFHQKGELTRAAELYHEFLRVALMTFGHSHRDVAVVLSGIAQIHQEKKKYAKALELYEASLCAGRAGGAR